MHRQPLAMKAVQHPESQPPRLLRRAVAARERNTGKMRETLIARHIRREELPAPRRSVVAPARPVECCAKHALMTCVLGKHRRDVRMMVLNAHEGNPLALCPRRETTSR